MNTQFSLAVTNAYRRYGRWGIGNDVNQIDQEGYDYWLAQLESGVIKLEEFDVVFDAAVHQSWIDNPKNISTLYTKAFSPGGGGYAEFSAALKEHEYMR